MFIWYYKIYKNLNKLNWSNSFKKSLKFYYHKKKITYNFEKIILIGIYYNLKNLLRGINNNLESKTKIYLCNKNIQASIENFKECKGYYCIIGILYKNIIRTVKGAEKIK